MKSTCPLLIRDRLMFLGGGEGLIPVVVIDNILQLLNKRIVS